jgi:hypothetical protein
MRNDSDLLQHYQEFCKTVMHDAEQLAHVMAPLLFDDFTETARHFCQCAAPLDWHEMADRVDAWHHTYEDLYRQAKEEPFFSEPRTVGIRQCTNRVTYSLSWHITVPVQPLSG